MIAALVALPLLSALLALVMPGAAARRALLISTAIGHTVLTVFACVSQAPAMLGGWIGLDPLGRLFLLTTSSVFLIVTFYAAGYLAAESRTSEDDETISESVFIACLLGFLAMMTMVTVSWHFGLLWVAVEGTTLTTAPLVFYHRRQGSLEATWKYLMICSVGIAIALLGTFFLAVAGTFGPDAISLDLASLLGAAPQMNPRWLQAAFLLMLVGYGTKMGLAPMHTWLPDAHSESPSVVSALLSATLLNCAFLGILRMRQVLAAAGVDAFANHLLVIFGLISMSFAAFFILGQSDYKRLLAYSSVEHMGILALGVGLGGAATLGAMLHVVNHAITKSLLFLVAGNTLAAYETRTIARVKGVLTTYPVTGALWLVGLFAIVGSPPFGTFHSELLVLRGTLASGNLMIPLVFLGTLALAFVGLSAGVLRMVQGTPDTPPTTAQREPLWSLVPPLVLAALALLLGLYIPGPLLTLVREAAQVLTTGGS